MRVSSGVGGPSRRLLNLGEGSGSGYGAALGVKGEGQEEKSLTSFQPLPSKTRLVLSPPPPTPAPPAPPPPPPPRCRGTRRGLAPGVQPQDPPRRCPVLGAGPAQSAGSGSPGVQRWRVRSPRDRSCPRAPGAATRLPSLLLLVLATAVRTCVEGNKRLPTVSLSGCHHGQDGTMVRVSL